MRRSILLLALPFLACGSRPDEGLAILEVTVSSEVPPFGTVRFSVDGRPEVRAREVPFDSSRPLRFGYYLPGPAGKVTIHAGALAARSCLVGEGLAEVDVQIGKISPAVPLAIARVKINDPACRGDAAPPEGEPPDAAGDTTHPDASDGSPAEAGADAPRDAPPADAPAPDVRPPPDTAPPPPMCLGAVQHCPGAGPCCAGLRCGNTTAGQVCCGDFNAGCTRPGGEDCCGQLECFKGRCCLPPVYFCAGHEGECCEGRTCGYTTAGHVCCGQAGAACTRPGGEDCCGQLECRNGHCAP
jgi:hypothetical protein